MTKTLATIIRQPADLARLIGDDAAAVRAAAKALAGREVYLVGSGSSFHAAQAGAFLLRRYAGLRARAVGALEFSLYPSPLTSKDAVIVISHRGTKHLAQDALAKAADKKALSILLTGVGAPASDADYRIETVELETSMAHTASCTGAIARLAQLALACAERHAGEELAMIADAVARVVETRAGLEHVAVVSRLARRILVIGAGPNFASAQEGALKLIEMAQATAYAYELENFLHGPIAAVERADVVILIPTTAAKARFEQLAAALVEVGCILWKVPATGVEEHVSPIVNIAYLQCIAHRLAELKEVNPDLNRREEAPYARAAAHYDAAPAKSAT